MTQFIERCKPFQKPKAHAQSSYMSSVELRICFDITIHEFMNLNFVNVIRTELFNPGLPEAVPVHFGEIADEMPSKLLAVAFETAQYRHDIVRTQSFSSFSGVKGSNTGSDRALHVKLISFTKA